MSHPDPDSEAPQADSHGSMAELGPKGFVRAFSSLRQRNFCLFWFGQLVSVIGSAMQSIGQAWLVLQVTHSAWQLGLVGALQALPILLFSIFGGVFADRWPKRRVLLITQTAAMLQALVLWGLIVTGALQLWQLYLLAFLLGLTNSLDRPARQSFVVEMVGRDNLPNAVALNASAVNLARIVGPGIGGIIISASSVTFLFLVNGLSFLAVLAALALIDSHDLYAQPRREAGVIPGVLPGMREGLSYVWKTPVVFLVITVVGLVLLFGSNFNVVLPLFTTDILHTGAAGFGSLSAALGLGALAAAFWLAWNSQKPTLRGILIFALVFGGLEAAFALSRFYLICILLLVGVGFAETTFAEQAIIMLQTVAPDRLRGRVMSVYVLFFDGSLPLGYLLMGWLTSLAGPSMAVLTGAFFSLLIAGAGWLRRKPAERQAGEPANSL